MTPFIYIAGYKPVSASVTPAHSKVGAPEGKLEIATICNGDSKQTFDFFAHCILPTIVNILELSFLVSFYKVKTFPLPDVNHVVVISESHLTSFPRTGV